MPRLVFQTKDSYLLNPYTQVLCETLQEIADTVVAYKLLELPEEITVSLRDQPFEDDNQEMISIGGCSVKHNLIELRIAPVYDVRMLVTFIHELVHIYQGHLGWLREVDNDEEGFIWFDRYFTIRGIKYEDYIELPWERMAFREQDVIWNQIKQHIGQCVERDKGGEVDQIFIQLTS